MAIEPGTTIDDRYQVIGQIGHGGMGDVFEVRGTALGNRFALKVIHAELATDDALRRRFAREARIQAMIDHPCIAKVFDVIEVDGRPGFIMEYVDAPTLRTVLDARRLSVDVVRTFAREILSGLAAAHDAGVVHRDLKPDNVFILEDGHGGMHAKLIDFGIAKVGADEGAHTATLTRRGDFLGTYRYASPEQIEQTSEVDGRSDLFSLGVVTWEMLSGLAPYSHASTPFGVQTAVVNDALAELPADVPDDLRRLVVELTRKDADERPQRAHDVLASLASSRAYTPAAETAYRMATPVQPAVAATALDRVSPVAPAPLPSPAPPPAPPPRVERAELASAALERTEWSSRLVARAIDDVIALVSVFFCFTAPLYPLLVLRRGAGSTPSIGQRVTGTNMLDVRTGEPASRAVIVKRNLLDLLAFQGPLALGLLQSVLLALPGQSGSLGLQAILVFWWFLVVGTEILVGMSNPQGRRIVDHLVGTRVVSTR